MFIYMLETSSSFLMDILIIQLIFCSLPLLKQANNKQGQKTNLPIKKSEE